MLPLPAEAGLLIKAVGVVEGDLGSRVDVVVGSGVEKCRDTVGRTRGTASESGVGTLPAAGESSVPGREVEVHLRSR